MHSFEAQFVGLNFEAWYVVCFKPRFTCWSTNSYKPCPVLFVWVTMCMCCKYKLLYKRKQWLSYMPSATTHLMNVTKLHLPARARWTHGWSRMGDYKEKCWQKCICIEHVTMQFIDWMALIFFLCVGLLMETWRTATDKKIWCTQTIYPNIPKPYN